MYVRYIATNDGSSAAKDLRTFLKSELARMSADVTQDHFRQRQRPRRADPFGHQWAIATHIEDMTMREMGKRMMAECGEA